MTTLTAITSAIILTCLWIRRYTWNCRWEKITTLSCTFMATSTLLRPFQPFLADILDLGAACAIVYSAVHKLTPDTEMRHWAILHLRAPAGATVAILTILYTTGHNSTYWIVYSTTIGYLLYHGTKAFIDLWYDPPSRTLVNIYFAASAFGGLCVTTRVLAALGVTSLMAISDAARSLTAATFAIGAASAWMTRVKWFTNRPGWAGIVRPHFRPWDGQRTLQS